MIEDLAGKYKGMESFVIKVGLPGVICGALLWILWHDLAAFRKDIAWKLERSIRNERSIMQKLEIPIILDGDAH